MSTFVVLPWPTSYLIFFIDVSLVVQGTMQSPYTYLHIHEGITWLHQYGADNWILANKTVRVEKPASIYKGYEDVILTTNISKQHLLYQRSRLQAIGEPPLFLATSVFFGIRHAIAAARSDVGQNDYFRLDSPATAEKIRMACSDQFTKRVRRRLIDLLR